MQEIISDSACKTEKGIHITTLCNYIVASIVILSALVGFFAIQLELEYDELQSLQNHFIHAYENSVLLQDASDSLTRHCQTYASTGKRVHMDMYFAEISSKRREQAIQNLDAPSEQMQILLEAKQRSDELMLLEYRIMRIVSEAQGLHRQEMRPELRDIVLTDHENAMNRPQKMAYARQLAFGPEYSSQKYYIDNAIDEFYSTALMHQSALIEENNSKVANNIMLLKFSLALAAIMILFFGWFFYRNIAHILNKFSAKLAEGKPMKEEKVQIIELRSLMRVYNELLSISAKHVNDLKQQADTDALTGAVNRRAFREHLDAMMDASPDPAIGLVLIDLDNFKNLNDTYGHPVGDQILKFLAASLKSRFRGTDLVGRLGGDEFAVLLVNIRSDGKDAVKRHINRLNTCFGSEETGIPPFSISVGAAFFKPGDTADTLYKRADLALYHTKENGRKGCTVAD